MKPSRAATRRKGSTLSNRDNRIFSEKKVKQEELLAVAVCTVANFIKSYSVFEKWTGSVVHVFLCHRLRCVHVLSFRSQVDEDAVHDSFYQLIAEHSQNGAPSEAFELQQLDRELTEESQGTTGPS